MRPTDSKAVYPPLHILKESTSRLRSTPQTDDMRRDATEASEQRVLVH